MGSAPYYVSVYSDHHHRIVLDIKYVGERGRREGGEEPEEEPEATGWGRRSGAEAMPQWSGENNTMGEHLSATTERMPLLGEHGSATIWRSA